MRVRDDELSPEMILIEQSSPFGERLLPEEADHHSPERHGNDEEMKLVDERDVPGEKSREDKWSQIYYHVQTVAERQLNSIRDLI
jgi:hypothetical protein